MEHSLLGVGHWMGLRSALFSFLRRVCFAKVNKGISTQSMTTEQLMALLPAGTVSRSIFGHGFYSTKRGIKYRMSFQEAWKYIVNMSDFCFYLFDASIKIGMSILMIYWITRGRTWKAVSSFIYSGFLLNLCSVFGECIYPIYNAEIDLVQGIIRGRCGKILLFKDIDYIKLYKRLKGAKFYAQGMYLYIVPRKSSSADEHDDIRIANLPIIDEYHAERVKDALLALLQKHVPVKYFVNDSEVKDLDALSYFYK